ncbi:MAG: hypothetical protein CSB24_03780 [Deltaproteobacteria bacterium]|nr:MAG: hypothetical protein CSB24_03780 [Deltaproteobacteria bacterium]
MSKDKLSLLIDKIKKTIKRAKQGGQEQAASFVADLPPDTPEHILDMMQEYEKIKAEPHQPITGWDFDRAFDFIEKYPESIHTAKLIEEMLDTTRETLKGLSYESAVNILQMLPSHRGAMSIINGIYKLEDDYIAELRSDIIMFIMEIAPDHPRLDVLGKNLVYNNFTKAYAFIEANPDHPETKKIIEFMFEKDPNIATLLLKERMDHAQVESILAGIYNIDARYVKTMMPDVLIFILEVAPDHKYEKLIISVLISKNYIKAFDFVKENPQHPHSAYMRKMICRKKPELAPLLGVEME